MIDSEPEWKKQISQVFSEHYDVEIPKDVLWASTGRGIDRTTQFIADHIGINPSPESIKKTIDEINYRVETNIVNSIPLRSHAKELIQNAKANNVKVAICSASTSEVLNSFFKKIELDHIFDLIYSTANSDFDKRKPHPYPYLKSMEILEVLPEQTIVVEDSHSGIESGVKSGAYTIAYENEYLKDLNLNEKPKCLVQDFLELCELLSF